MGGDLRCNFATQWLDSLTTTCLNRMLRTPGKESSCGCVTYFVNCDATLSRRLIPRQACGVINSAGESAARVAAPQGASGPNETSPAPKSCQIGVWQCKSPVIPPGTWRVAKALDSLLSCSIPHAMDRAPSTARLAQAIKSHRASEAASPWLPGLYIVDISGKIYKI